MLQGVEAEAPEPRLAHPASPEATGLEVDKFDGAAVRRYLETYLSMYRDAVGADNLYIFGLRNRAVTALDREQGSAWIQAPPSNSARR